MGLFDPAEHEPLTKSWWDDGRARAGIDRIVADSVEEFVRGKFWPRNPLDSYGLTVERDRSLWIGAAGVLWALDYLGAGLGEGGVYESYLAQPDTPESPGLMMGETGVLLISWRLAPTAAKQKRLFELVAANRRNPEHELFNGAPGTMLAALHVFEATGAESWARGCWHSAREAVSTGPQQRIPTGLSSSPRASSGVTELRDLSQVSRCFRVTTRRTSSSMQPASWRGSARRDPVELTPTGRLVR